MFIVFGAPASRKPAVGRFPMLDGLCGLCCCGRPSSLRFGSSVPFPSIFKKKEIGLLVRPAAGVRSFLPRFLEGEPLFSFPALFFVVGPFSLLFGSGDGGLESSYFLPSVVFSLVYRPPFRFPPNPSLPLFFCHFFLPPRFSPGSPTPFTLASPRPHFFFMVILVFFRFKLQSLTASPNRIFVHPRRARLFSARLTGLRGGLSPYIREAAGVFFPSAHILYSLFTPVLCFCHSVSREGDLPGSRSWLLFVVVGGVPFPGSLVFPPPFGLRNFRFTSIHIFQPPSSKTLACDPSPLLYGGRPVFFVLFPLLAGLCVFFSFAACQSHLLRFFW